MSLVEGIGDEVLQFFGILIAVSLGLLAWWSTHISEAPLIRTVLILERRTRGRPVTDLNTQANTSVVLDNNERTIDTGQEDGEDLPEMERDQMGDHSAGDKDEHESGSSLLVPVNESSNAEVPVTQASATPQQDRQVEAEQVQLEVSQETSNTTENDTDSFMLRRRRLAFFQNRGPTLIEASDAPDAPDTNDTAASVEEISPATEDVSGDHIRIRLKYLNDDQIVVEGRLQEQLGDFKRRHFRIELAAEKMVRLIFNGQVLQSDSQTLQGYGLFDNCVVHCLVHNQRSSAQRSAQDQANSPSNPSNPPDWNLGNFLYSCLTILIGFTWYCRFAYSHLFTTTTTASLFGLTCFFIISCISMYFPDTENLY